MRGNLCPYDHFTNVDPIVVDEASLKLPGMQRVTDSILGRGGEGIPGLDPTEEVGGSYNPENPFMKSGQPTAIPLWPQQQIGLQPIPTLTGQFPLLGPPLPIRNNDESFRNDLTSGGPMFMSGGNRGRGRGRGGGMRGRGPPKRPYNQDGDDGGGNNNDNNSQGGGGYNSGGRENYGQDRPPRRRRFEKRPNTDSICVARIPAELNTIEQLNSHFKKFGTIVNIQVTLFIFVSFCCFLFINNIFYLLD